uniref:Calcium uptake protein 1 homolog, mitochondrial n=1 Tax=Dracunculus medinensis TaxID=318479 RepID=A0A0N4U0Y3_DRAME
LHLFCFKHFFSNCYIVSNILGNKRVSVFHYTDRKSGRGYSNFASTIYPNRPYIWPPFRKLYRWNFIFAFILVFASYESKFYGHSEPNIGENDREKKKKKKRKVGFRERRIIEYENRLRCYSSIDKIFRYFASIKKDSPSRPYEIFMTPEDFVRSITPGIMQPRNLGLDQYKTYEEYKRELVTSKGVFAKLGEYGLINYNDYLFLMTLLSASAKDFKLAFKLFDVNGNGELDKAEFEYVQELIMMQTMIGQKHHERAGLYNKQNLNSTLKSYFFGEDGSKKLSIDEFLIFQAHLHRDILKIECERRDAEFSGKGKISEVSFAEILLLHSCLTDVKKRVMLKRVKKKFGNNSNEKTGVTLDEIYSFFCFLYYIEDVDLALNFYNIAGAAIDAELLKRVARKVTGCHISDHVVDIVITLFDDNQDGRLSQKEFISIMKKRMNKGLRRSRDTRLMKLIGATNHCVVEQLKNSFYYH